MWEGIELELNNLKGVNDLTTMIGKLTALQKLSVDNKGFWTYDIDNDEMDPPLYAAYLKSIPTEIGRCTDLTSLNITYQVSNIKGDYVGTTGQIPTEIGNLTLLKNLNMVSMTGLTGAIPVQIGNLTELNNLNIQNTCLRVSDDGIKGIESLAVYETDDVILNNNCITKAELPNAKITKTNCIYCGFTCKGCNTFGPPPSVCDNGYLYEWDLTKTGCTLTNQCTFLCSTTVEICNDPSKGLAACYKCGKCPNFCEASDGATPIGPNGLPSCGFCYVKSQRLVNIITKRICKR